jgi:glucose/arabinose dehydrogenase
MTESASRRRIPALLGLWVAVAGCGGSSSGGTIVTPPPPPPPTPTIALQPVFEQLPSPFVAPVAMLQAPGDASRWFVVEQRGTVQVFDNTPTVNSMSTFIDIQARVSSTANEAGLLGMAFHPDFAANGQVFLSYTAPGSSGGRPLDSIVSRFASNDGGLTLDPASESIVQIVFQDAGNHNGGNIAFGPDGFLYAGFGDGGGSGDPSMRGQDTSNLLGTFTRIDVDGGTPYAIPPGNPFAGEAICVNGFSAGGNCPEIFAWGLRNPWRWSFDSLNGDLWAGDVGQGAWEEIDKIEASNNYGWNIREGAHCFNATSCNTMGLVDPVTEYGRADGNSTTGGYVYRGSVISDLVGNYIFGDFGSGRIWAVPASSQPGTVPAELLSSGLNISAFAEGVDGELYVLHYGGGTVSQIIDAP